MIVIADTSVILNLCCIQQQRLLRALFSRVTVPPAVRSEFERAARTYPRFAELSLPDWIEEQPPQSIPDALRCAPHLDAGEIAAIALALELRADAVLIDEREGRRAARQLGLITVGVVGILVRARSAGVLPKVAPLLDQLEGKANFWLGPEIRAETLRLVGEVP